MQDKELVEYCDRTGARELSIALVSQTRKIRPFCTLTVQNSVSFIHHKGRNTIRVLMHAMGAVKATGALSAIEPNLGCNTAHSIEVDITRLSISRIITTQECGVVMHSVVCVCLCVYLSLLFGL